MPHKPLPRHGGYRAQALVADDDAPSAHYFASALDAMQCRAEVVHTGQQAMRKANESGYDLLLLDCRMPDFGAEAILANLRRDYAAASHTAPAIATSAELDPGEQTRLRQAGFADALLKPVSRELLQRVVMPWLPAAPGRLAQAVLDDRVAIDSCGSIESMTALRGLFVQELESLQTELDQAVGDRRALSERLHRLLASCGLCGANALAAATRELKQQLDSDGPVFLADMQDFRDTLSDTLDALA